MSTTSAARRRKLQKPQKPPVNMTVLAALSEPVTLQQIHDAFVSFGWVHGPDFNDPPDLAEVRRRYDGYHVLHRERMESTYAILERFYWALRKHGGLAIAWPKSRLSLVTSRAPRPRTG